MKRNTLKSEIERLIDKRLKPVIARLAGISGTPGSVNATRTSTSGVIGAALTNTFDAPAYTPVTTGSALLIVNSLNTTSGSGDGVALIPRLGMASIANVAGNADAVGGTVGSGSLTTVIAIVAGVPIVPGVQIAQNTGGHTVATGAAGLQVTIVELQTH